MNETIEKKRTISWHNILLAIIFFVGGYISFGFINEYVSSRPEAKDMSLFWEVWNTMEEKYPFDEPNNQEKIYGAIEGLVKSYGDDYSSFLPPVRSEFFNQTITGEFGGAGMEIGVREGFLVVISPLKNSPAEKAGILPNDIITHVDDVDISGDSLDEAISRIRGKIGTSVTLTLLRRGESEALEISLTREEVHIPIIETEIIENVFIIHLYNFNEASDTAFKDALEKFKKSGKKQLLIDLRNNPGGYLDAAVAISSYFLPQGTVIVREQHGEDKDDQITYRSKGYKLLDNHQYETMVLINGGSASASEILAGALSENDAALVVGEQSYGKGSVQELLRLPQGTSLKVTVAKWLTPLGNQISKVGIEPDVKIPVREVETERDIQLYDAVTLFDTQ